MNDLLTKEFSKEVKEIKKLTNKTLLVTFTDDEKVILKMRDKPNKMYRYLKGLGLENVLYPIKHLSCEGKDYYAYPFLQNNHLRDDQMVLILKDNLMKLHEHTLIEKPLKKMNLKNFTGYIKDLIINLVL